MTSRKSFTPIQVLRNKFWKKSSVNLSETIPPRSPILDRTKGEPNLTLDSPFTLPELHAALAKLTRNTSPGNDKVTNRILRNLPDKALNALLDYMNKCWEEGELPAEWKHAEVIMIPKPNKPLQTSNLRPISLTSCAGKLLEHMVHDRLTTYLEDSGLMPDTMFGFRQLLSAQDILLQLKEDLLDYLERHKKFSILALDVKGAFDNVKHDAILQNLQDTNCGIRTYQYVQDFQGSHGYGGHR